MCQPLVLKHEVSTFLKSRFLLNNMKDDIELGTRNIPKFSKMFLSIEIT